MIPQINEGNCEVCEEIITQPVCHECLEREMIEWLIHKKENKADLISFIKQTTISFAAYDYIQTKCVICGKKMGYALIVIVKKYLIISAKNTRS